MLIQRHSVFIDEMKPVLYITTCYFVVYFHSPNILSYNTYSFYINILVHKKERRDTYKNKSKNTINSKLRHPLLPVL